ncbi:MAG: AarF/ABC1/UbiB kinase family protein, partial [Halobacteriaceae archaeon]
QAMLRTPPKLERMLERFDRDDFYVRADIEDSDQLLDRLAIRIIYGLIIASGILATTVLYVFASLIPTIIAGGATVFVGLLLYRSYRKRRGIRAKPQFTRQNLRQRRRNE